MRRVLTVLLDGVPLCASTERAIAATLADWRHEAARTRSAAARVGVSARYGIALMRAVAGSAFRQVPLELRSPFLWRLALAAVLTIALLAWLSPAAAWASTGAVDRVWLSVLQAAWISLTLILVVVFVSEATGRPARSGPSLAGGLVLAAALYVVLFVGFPEAFNYVAMRTWQEYTWPALADGRLPPMVSPFRLLTGGPTRDVSSTYLIFAGLNWLTLSMAAWSFSVLAYRVRQYGRLVVWSAIVAVLILVLGVRLLTLGLQVPIPSYLVHAGFALGALATSSWLARRTTSAVSSSGRLA